MRLTPASTQGFAPVTWRQRLSHLLSNDTARWWAGVVIIQSLFSCALLARLEQNPSYSFTRVVPWLLVRVTLLLMLLTLNAHFILTAVELQSV